MYIWILNLKKWLLQNLGSWDQAFFVLDSIHVQMHQFTWLFEICARENMRKNFCTRTKIMLIFYIR